MPKFNDERKALELLPNHAQFKTTLQSLTMSSDLSTLQSHVHAVAEKWFRLARQHLADAKALGPRKNPRGVYSRSYYAAYNASKAVRYIAHGSVSLRGDDHKKVGQLPSSFPDVDSWATKLSLLYEHRLRADYDNWSDTTSENTLSPKDCLNLSCEFLSAAEAYLCNEYGLKI